jgi:hypothetical protein
VETERFAPAQRVAAGAHRIADPQAQACRQQDATESHTRSAVALSVLLSALVLRLALAPLSEGWDFLAYSRLVQFTLHGHDVYTVSPHFLQVVVKALPWSYSPLCLNMFVSLGWVVAHTGWSFRIVGKLPTIAADVGVGWLLYLALRRRGQSARVSTLGMALYLFNPLVLLSGAFLGRFDAIALVFLLLALESKGWFAPAYALGVAAKTFPIFLLPLLALGRDRRPWRHLVLACILVPVCAVPYSITEPWRVLHYLVRNNTISVSPFGLGRLSWYLLLFQNHWLSMAQINVLARIATLLFPVALLLAVQKPLYVKGAFCFTLFLVVNRTVYEQYLLWPLPFLIVMGLCYRSRLALGLMAFYTVAGMLENEQTDIPNDSHFYYSLLPTPWLPLNLALAIATLVFLGAQVLPRRARWETRRWALPALRAPGGKGTRS